MSPKGVHFKFVRESLSLVNELMSINLGKLIKVRVNFIVSICSSTYESPHDKTNKMTVRPAKKAWVP